MAVNYDALRKMTEAQLRELNAGIVQVIRERIAQRQQSAMRVFNVGDKAQFRCSRTGRMLTVIIDKFNHKTVGATELNPDGSRSHRTWRVAPSLLTALV